MSTGSNLGKNCICLPEAPSLRKNTAFSLKVKVRLKVTFSWKCGLLCYFQMLSLYSRLVPGQLPWSQSSDCCSSWGSGGKPRVPKCFGTIFTLKATLCLQSHYSFVPICYKLFIVFQRPFLNAIAIALHGM